MVFNVHRNRKGGRKEGGRGMGVGGMEVGEEEVDYIPVATLSPPE